MTRPLIGPPGLLMADTDIPDKFLPAIRLVVNNLVWILPLVAIEQAVTGEVRNAIILAILFAIDLVVAVKWGFLGAIVGKIRLMSITQLVLFAGVLGTWISLTACLGAGAWIIWTGHGLAGLSAESDPGPIRWGGSFSIEGDLRTKVLSLRFLGVNVSQTEALQLKEANILSAIDGTLLPLEIVGVTANGETKIVPIDKVQLIPPGARVELVAKFGDPDPGHPGMILGLEPKTFLEKWRQFSFNVKDNIRSYRINFDDRAMMVFFQGKVGPRIMIKPDGS